MLSQITPVILTYNEEPNIQRVLDQLTWAVEVLVVDSMSADETKSLAGEYPNVRIIERPFDTHSNQWNFAIHDTGVSSEWVLALDADYVLNEELRAELEALNPPGDVDGYWCRFRYCISGKPLRSSIYPPVLVLFRRTKAAYLQDGHTQRLQLEGRKECLVGKIYHDDRKPLSAWLKAQDNYANIESELISRTDWRELSAIDGLRKLIVFAPFLMFLYCLIIKGGILDGFAGLKYALERTVAEALLSIKLVERKLSRE
jgi:glycosyltransferase involved in cell wall biosynthesis